MELFSIDSPKNHPCTRCGKPSYERISGEFRCFPHAVPKQRHVQSFVRFKLKQSERYQLGHIDVGFPYVAGGRQEERMNGARETAWGHNQLAQTPARRAGLDR